MSIAKKREKRAKNDSPQENEGLPRYLVSEEEMLEFISSLGIREVDATAASMQLVADLTYNTDRLDEANIARIWRLINEVKNERYRQIMSEIIVAIKRDTEGIRSAHLTASHIVEMAFKWTREYFAVLALYRAKLRMVKQTAESKIGQSMRR